MDYERKLTEAKSSQEKLEMDNECMNNDIGIILNKMSELESRMRENDQERDFLYNELNITQQKMQMTEEQLGKTIIEKEEFQNSLHKIQGIYITSNFYSRKGKENERSQHH